MSIKGYVTDACTGAKARVIGGTEYDNTHSKNAIVVATRPAQEYINTIKFFTNDTYGADMNQNAAFSGNAEEIHNGTDDTYWTASSVIGDNFTFNSTDQSKGGTKSIKIDAASVDDVFQITKGSYVDLSSYIALTMWVYVDKDWATGDSVAIYGWDTGTGSQVGNNVNLQDYFNFETFDTWQSINIPLNNLGLGSSSLDALRVKQVAKDGKKSPKYYLDDIQFEELGDPIVFAVTPNKETWLYVKTITFSMADAIQGTAGLPSLSYDQLLGETLTNGLVYQRIHDGEVVFSFTISQLMDLMQFPGATIQAGTDGANVWLTVPTVFQAPPILKFEDEDRLEITLLDNLTGLLHFKVSVEGMEQRG